MGVLVGDLLLLSRLDEGRPLEQHPVDLGLVASEAVDAARAVDPTRPLRLDVAGLVEVLGDRVRLRQVVDNLLSNARVHTPPGVPVEVDVRGDTGRGEATVRVVDHGPGVAAGLAEAVFDRFHRVDPSRPRAEEPALDGPGRVAGTGLGLAIVRAIVEAHGGRVTLAGTEGGGATLVVTLALLVPPGDPNWDSPRDDLGVSWGTQ
jgi:two-component system, OmpR family, sensor kinase